MRVRYSFSSRRTRTIDAHNQHKEAFPKLVREMVEKCDIILEVLDARYIDETRNKELESLVQEKNRKLIYVINKADFINVPEKKKETEGKNLFPFVFVSCKSKRGIADLRERIKIEITRAEIKFPKANIGVIGYPNTGKSSLINVLTGRASARSAAEAGFTKGIQKIRMTSGIFILDTPGVIPEEKYSSIDSGKVSEHAKISVRTYDKVKDPDLVVHTLMSEYPGAFEKFYNIDASGDSEKLIQIIGKKKNFLLKGNTIDTDRASRLILKDWQEGKISLS